MLAAFIWISVIYFQGRSLPKTSSADGLKISIKDAENKNKIVGMDSRALLNELHPRKKSQDGETPPELSDVVANLTTFVKKVQQKFYKLKQGEKNPVDIWNKYYTLAEKFLIPMDIKYKGQTTHPIREDDSIFVSVASYRDEVCPETLKSMFESAANPERLFVGLVMQNCNKDCKTGVIDKRGTIKDAGPDMDCYKEFCESEVGRSSCENQQVRLLSINETESLGPAQARYFATKLWQGEQWFFQIDSHCTFSDGWDKELLQEYFNCPTSNPKRVLTHYPPSPDVTDWKSSPGMRICDPKFATSDIESEIIRLDSSRTYDKEITGPRYAPFVAAGFFFTHSSFLADVPFDPLLPWVFMGEEILLSSRFWTNGWDIFSPSRNVLTHYYTRRHKPRFWETVGRVFQKPGIHNPIQLKVIERVKNLMGYPENHDDLIFPQTLIAHKDLYGMGNKRRLDHFMNMVGINVQTKRIETPEWCHRGESPPLME